MKGEQTMAVPEQTTRKRIRRIGSIKQELLKKSREAALAAVQIFNSPNIIFKSEIYIVLMHIAWTYLLHAYYRSRRIDYRYYEKKDTRRKFDRTKKGAYKFWELERCLNDKDNPLDKDTVNNLRFLIGLRHEIEHQMTTRIDDFLSARFQAASLNFNNYIKKLFGEGYGLDRYLSFSLQFSSLSEEQVERMLDNRGLPSHIAKFIEGFDGMLTDDEFNSPRFAYRVLFVPKTANRKGQADRVIEFIKADSPMAGQVNAQYVLIKEAERPKYRPGQVVAMMREKGFVRFNMYYHTMLWRSMKAREPGKGFGVEVAGTWYWYESWIRAVEQHCKENRDRYK
jgi:hypothetical protein